MSTLRKTLAITSFLALLGTGPLEKSAAADRAPARALTNLVGAPNNLISEGASPAAPLIADSSGALYGTTEVSGGTEWGTVFKLTPSGNSYQESVLYQFQGTPDAGQPMAGLLADNSGALYGTTWAGGNANQGAVFKLTPNANGYCESVLYSFQGGPDGGSPFSSLIADASGGLYGTASRGGSTGNGVVFKLTPSGNTYVESVLYSFQGGIDGAWPTASLIADSSGGLYSTTAYGGTLSRGTVFKLTPNGNSYRETVLYNFSGHADGGLPKASLVADAGGTLYGTAGNGGNLQCSIAGCGAVFKLTPSHSGYVESVLHAFDGRSDGKWPEASLFLDSAGSLNGTARGGDTVPGTVFKLAPSAGGYSYRVLHRFGRVFPIAAVIEDGFGSLYSTTVYGGKYGIGTVFKLTRHENDYGERILHSFHP